MRVLRTRRTARVVWRASPAGGTCGSDRIAAGRTGMSVAVVRVVSTRRSGRASAAGSSGRSCAASRASRTVVAMTMVVVAANRTGCSG
jgi:hypothetical protein